jgi:hypothetical protein
MANRAPRQVDEWNRDGRGAGMARRATGRSGDGRVPVPEPVPVPIPVPVLLPVLLPMRVRLRVTAGPRSDER